MNTNWERYLEEREILKGVRDELDVRWCMQNTKKHEWELYLIRHKQPDWTFNRYLRNRMEERRRISSRKWYIRAKKLRFQNKYGNIRAD